MSKSNSTINEENIIPTCGNCSKAPGFGDCKIPSTGTMTGIATCDDHEFLLVSKGQNADHRLQKAENQEPTATSEVEKESQRVRNLQDRIYKKQQKITALIVDNKKLRTEALENWQQWHLLRVTCPRCGEIRTGQEANDKECGSCRMTVDDPTYAELVAHFEDVHKTVKHAEEVVTTAAKKNAELKQQLATLKKQSKLSVTDRTAKIIQGCTEEIAELKKQITDYRLQITDSKQRLAEAQAEVERWIPVEDFKGPPTQYWAMNLQIGNSDPIWAGIVTTWSKKEGFYLEDDTQVELTHIRPITFPDYLYDDTQTADNGHDVTCAIVDEFSVDVGGAEAART